MVSYLLKKYEKIPDIGYSSEVIGSKDSRVNKKIVRRGIKNDYDTFNKTRIQLTSVTI